jgi:hypothetical protein
MKDQGWIELGAYDKAAVELREVQGVWRAPDSCDAKFAAKGDQA